MQEVTNNPNATPVASVGKKPCGFVPDSLVGHIRNLLRRADAEPNDKIRFALLERARDLSRSFRKQGGFLTWASAAVALVVVFLLVSAIVRAWPREKFYTYPSDYLRVVKNLDPCLSNGSCGYRFVVQSVSQGVAGPETEMHFCEKGIQPRFEQGHTLSWIRYASIGSCNSIDGFDVVRGADRFPILAPNCKPDYSLAPVAGHIVCEGGSAKF